MHIPFIESPQHTARRLNRLYAHTHIRCEVHEWTHRDDDGTIVAKTETPVLMEVSGQYSYNQTRHPLGPVNPTDDPFVAYNTKIDYDKRKVYRNMQKRIDRIMQARKLLSEQKRRDFKNKFRKFLKEFEAPKSDV